MNPSERVQQIIGSYLEPVPPKNPLFAVVESEIKSGRLSDQVSAFLKKLPENPRLENVHISKVTETNAQCIARCRLNDNENPRYFYLETEFEVDLASGTCHLMT